MKNLPVRTHPVKMLALFFILHLISAGPVYCGDKEHLEYALTLVEKTDMANMFVELAETFMEPYFEQYENPRSEKLEANPLLEEFIKEVRLGEDELKWMLAGIYARYFTENELREVVEFFSSPAGSAWLDKRLIVQTESEQIGLEWGKLLTQRVFQNLKAKSGD